MALPAPSLTSIHMAALCYLLLDTLFDLLSGWYAPGGHYVRTLVRHHELEDERAGRPRDSWRRCGPPP